MKNPNTSAKTIENGFTLKVKCNIMMKKKQRRAAARRIRSLYDLRFQRDLQTIQRQRRIS